MPTVITPPTDINEAVVDCGVGQVGADLNKMEPVHFVLANPDDLFQACEIADLVDAPTKGGGPLQVLTAAPDVLGRLSFIFEDGVCWDRVLRVTPTPEFDTDPCVHVHHRPDVASWPLVRPERRDRIHERGSVSGDRRLSLGAHSARRLARDPDRDLQGNPDERGPRIDMTRPLE